MSTQSVKWQLWMLIKSMARDGSIHHPDMNLVARQLSIGLERPVSHHDVSKVLWSLQKEGRLKMSYTHKDGRSRTGVVTRIEILR